jgi:hypothetical protein
VDVQKEIEDAVHKSELRTRNWVETLRSIHSATSALQQGAQKNRSGFAGPLERAENYNVRRGVLGIELEAHMLWTGFDRCGGSFAGSACGAQ